MRTRTVLATFALLLLGGVTVAEAKRLVILTDTTPPRVQMVDSAAPNVLLSDLAMTGLDPGETVQGMDLRPANGQVYLLTHIGGANRLRTLSVSNGAAGPPVALTADPTDGTNPFTSFLDLSLTDIDFNPVADRLRVTDGQNRNGRVNPSNGLVTTDVDLNPGAPDMSSVAYINSYAGATLTTLFGIDIAATDRLVIQNPPNNGTLATVGTGLGIDFTTPTAMDIAPENNQAFLAGINLGVVRLFSVNLTTGIPTLLGSLGSGVAVTDITAVENIVGLAMPSTTVAENGGTVDVVLHRAEPRGAVSVRITSAGGTATQGTDFAAVDQTVTFPAGETTATVSVPVQDDAVVESPEELTLTLNWLATPTGINTVLGRTSMTVRVVDDDRSDRDGDGVPDAADKCPTVADPAQADGNANGVGTACDPTEVIDTTRPAILLSAASPTKAALRTRGLPVTYSCSEGCTMRLTLTVGTRRIGTVTTNLTAAGVRRATVRLTPAGKLAILTARRVTLTGRATDASGNISTSRLTLTLR